MAWYEPDSFHLTVGSVNSGSITDLYTDDANRHVLEEMNNTPGMDYEYWFESLPATVHHFRLLVNGYYYGNPAHQVNIQVWNFTTSAWVDEDIMLAGVGDQDYLTSDLLAADYSSGGQVRVRFLHPAPGNTSHRLYLDEVVLEDRSGLYTTAIPTTVPPTTVPPTPTSTVPPTTLAPTTAPDYDIVVDPIEIRVSNYAIWHYYPPREVDPNLDNKLDFGAINIEVSQEGEPGNVGVVAGSIDLVFAPQAGLDIGQVLPGGAIYIYISLASDGYLIDHELCNWVKWSKIGVLDFTIDESNLAGERPMDWRGCVFHIAKLQDKIAVYGDNGVAWLKPSGVHMGMDTVYHLGLKNKGAFCGDENDHYFVNKLGELIHVSSGFEKLDYSEFLNPLGTVILSMDIEKKLIYITDGTTGYIYSTVDKSFGRGIGNLTGIGTQDNIVSVVSNGVIVTPKFNICTDIYDLGTRKPKTIASLEVGSNVSEFLYVSVDYRTDYREPFRRIGWFLVNPSGRAYPKCYGVEFRFRVVSTIYEYFELDYLKVRGHIHGYSYLDQYQY